VPRGPAEPTESTKRYVATRAGNRCAFPGCPHQLTMGATERSPGRFVGVCAHIRGEVPGAARYDATMSDSERREARNLVYLCGHHHSVVDSMPGEYPAEWLEQVKGDHEERVARALAGAVSDVTFEELQAVVDHIAGTASRIEDGFHVVRPEDKLRRNGLTATSAELLRYGSVRAHDVGRYVEERATEDPSFPYRLRGGFLERYGSLVHAGVSGDELFSEMQVFASRRSDHLLEQGAGLAVLTYLFEACEVFEQ